VSEDLSMFEEGYDELVKRINDDVKNKVDIILNSFDARELDSWEVSQRNVYIGLLKKYLGENGATFFLHILSMTSITDIDEYPFISEEMKEYFYYLLGKQGYTKSKMLSKYFFSLPDAWFEIRNFPIKYDLDEEACYIKLQILKNNLDNIVIEDEIGDILLLCTRIIESIIDEAEKLKKFGKKIECKQALLEHIDVINKLKTLLEPISK